ncbi:Asp23/Gls24 family envelope stress response protein [Erysipelothrix piscisicarius]|uniref:Asp23/Gls24 family envelope stress response protein n=1 Tax=Erysipelothrix piscisicarius TaxID=2485784 RepID=A0A3S8RMZ6_9FIRM|nr:Asp23/Gls24 family envelope stress response protein [Erysipelothrix piscisicarius]AZK44310.1 Asp23/Gls24 family envelope stress response protein [Erysipelothrix piscisicarius]
MSNEYVLIQNEKTGFGQIAISNNVINHIVQITVNENDAIFFEDGSGKKSLIVSNENGHVNVDLKVRVKYGKDVERVCRALQNDLQRNIELMVDFSNTSININVVGFKFN